MEPIYRKDFYINDAAVDCFGRLKPSMLLYYAQEVAGEHFEILETDYDGLAAKNLFWAITRTHVDIARMPRRGETITLETWPMPTTRVAYPRAILATDTEGNVLFRSVSLWVLMDLETRSMVLPGKSGIQVPGFLRGNELDVPRSLMAGEYPNRVTRTVTYSLLDRNGHMNNTRYLDWTCDLLTAPFHREHVCKDFTICYLSEAVEQQQIDIAWTVNGEDILRVDAYPAGTDDRGRKDRVFSVQMGFQSSVL